MFTIIICTYNGERTIKKTIQRILEQKKYDSLIEQLIIVDNASNDNTRNIVGEFLKTNKIIYSYEARAGLANARLNGVKLATADWTVFVDDDNELDYDWIENAAFYIGKNPNIGIFGGTVIPKLEFDANNEEYERLCNHKGMLACTDLKRSEIDFSRKNSPFGGIIGAGMVIRTQYLKELSELGWIKQMGRFKDSTGAGDDGEISRFVTEKKHKKAGYCPHLIIEHNLPRNRLQENYLLKLQESLAIANYNGQSLKKFYILRRIKSIIKFAIKKNPYTDGTFEYKMYNISKNTYVKLLAKDKMFFRGL